MSIFSVLWDSADPSEYTKPNPFGPIPVFELHKSPSEGEADAYVAGNIPATWRRYLHFHDLREMEEFACSLHASSTHIWVALHPVRKDGPAGSIANVTSFLEETSVNSLSIRLDFDERGMMACSVKTRSGQQMHLDVDHGVGHAVAWNGRMSFEKTGWYDHGWYMKNHSETVKQKTNVEIATAVWAHQIEDMWIMVTRSKVLALNFANGPSY